MKKIFACIAISFAVGATAALAGTGGQGTALQGWNMQGTTLQGTNMQGNVGPTTIGSASLIGIELPR